MIVTAKLPSRNACAAAGCSNTPIHQRLPWDAPRPELRLHRHMHDTLRFQYLASHRRAHGRADRSRGRVRRVYQVRTPSFSDFTNR